MAFRGERLTKESILDIKPHYTPTESFQYTCFTSCRPPGGKIGFNKGEATVLIWNNSSNTTFEDRPSQFKVHLHTRLSGNICSNVRARGEQFCFKSINTKTKTNESREDISSCHYIPPFSTKEPKNPLWRWILGFLFDALWSEISSINMFNKETQRNAKYIFGFKNPILDLLKQTHPKTSVFELLINRQL